MLERHELVQLLVVEKQDFFFGQAEVFFGNAGVPEPSHHRSAANDILEVQVVVLFKQRVQVLLLLLVSHLVFVFFIRDEWVARATF